MKTNKHLKKFSTKSRKLVFDYCNSDFSYHYDLFFGCPLRLKKICEKLFHFFLIRCKPFKSKGSGNYVVANSFVIQAKNRYLVSIKVRNELVPYKNNFLDKK
ncbi:hypothetical protein CNR22_05565 [Sphingobacteriaceae bacterium]|nr:hypothetical protein CNR22_05565 [Sphingobacteriaceae bacterium]